MGELSTAISKLRRETENWLTICGKNKKNTHGNRVKINIHTQVWLTYIIMVSVTLCFSD